MIRFKTSRFGELEVSQDKIITFPDGILGFPHLKEYILIDYKDTTLKWLQSVNAPDVAFIVIEPRYVFPDYKINEERIIEKLELKQIDDLAILAIISVKDNQVTVNLQAPLLINSILMKGIQMVFEDSFYSHREPLKQSIFEAK